ncbi:NAD(P)H-dependent oxidoreductase [Enterococcus rivorum]|nr:NAD(P)H-dependent oxidoreductase [Enterococcus rivorum]MBP2100492.1 modulator of drug activity B [Enterococcus rivorum]
MNIHIINGYQKPNMQIDKHQSGQSMTGLLSLNMVKSMTETLENLGHDVSVTYLSEGMNISDELTKINNAKLLIFQTPVYWMSTPSNLKKYFDDVYINAKGLLYKDDGRTNGGKYGSGYLSHSKYYILSTTWNAPEKAFERGAFFDGKSADDVFLNFHLAQKWVGMYPLKSFHLYDVFDSHFNYSKMEKDLNSHLLTQLSEIKK